MVKRSRRPRPVPDADKVRANRKGALPTADEILEFIGSHPKSVGKREIARAFSVRGADKQNLRDLLRDMKGQGLLESRRKKVNRADSLPTVCVLRVLGPDQDGELIARPAGWNEDERGPSPVIVITASNRPNRREDNQPPAAGDQILARIAPTGDATYPYTAKVIRRLAGQERRRLGVVREASPGKFVAEPVDRKIRGEYKLNLARSGNIKAGDLVSLMVRKDRGYGPQVAEVGERLGRIESPRNISLISIHERGIPDDFPAEVLAEADTIEPAAITNRTDLRSVPLITIDPHDARDHDDAVWAGPDPHPANPGGHVIVVAIADVAAFIRHGSALDREARLRGNSVYFPDRVVPMLPERISNDLCSLREGEDRLVLACTMTFDAHGKRRSFLFERAVMRSAAKLSYEEAQAAIYGNPNDQTRSLLETTLKPLWQAWKSLDAGRKRRSPLELNMPERRLKLTSDGVIEEIVTPPRLDAHRLIEEFMIQANVAAATALEERRSPLIYRIHDEPSREKMAALGEFLSTLNLPAMRGQVLKPLNFNRLLQMVEGKDYEHVVNEMVLRTQAQAIYSHDNQGHFGLNLQRYAHFTSPIRRYADLVVHRALIAALGLGTDGLKDAEVGELARTAEWISDTERRAMAAERDTFDRFVASHLATRIGSTFSGRIRGVVKAGLFITLNETGADGFVPSPTLRGDRFHLDEISQSLRGEFSGTIYSLGDKVEVRLLEVSPVKGALRLEMLSEGRPGPKFDGRRKRKTPGHKKTRHKSR